MTEFSKFNVYDEIYGGTNANHKALVPIGEEWSLSEKQKKNDVAHFATSSPLTTLQNEPLFDESPTLTAFQVCSSVWPLFFLPTVIVFIIENALNVGLLTKIFIGLIYLLFIILLFHYLEAGIPPARFKFKGPVKTGPMFVGH